MRTLNKDFLDKMHILNAKAQDKGFVNAVNWAKIASKAHEITKSQYDTMSRLHNIRNEIAHGNARDIEITQQTIDLLNFYFKAMNKSKVKPEPKNNRFDKEKKSCSKGYSSAAAELVTETARGYNIHKQSLDDARMAKIIDVVEKKVSTWMMETKLSILDTYDASYRVSAFTSKKKVNRIVAETMVANMSDSEIQDLLNKM